MCLADFSSNYRVVFGQQAKEKNVYQLLNDMEFIQKRTANKAAFIRYAQFKEKKQPEKFTENCLNFVLHCFNAQLRPQ